MILNRRCIFKDVVCCTENEFCNSNYGCEELPLEMRYRESGPDWNFIGCCELIVTTTPAPTTTTSFISYYEGDGNCTEETEERYSRDKFLLI